MVSVSCQKKSGNMRSGFRAASQPFNTTRKDEVMPEDLWEFSGGTMTKELFTALLGHGENEKVDFKREPYRLDNDVLKSKLIKDIASIANTNPPNRPGYILIGVKAWNQGGTPKRDLQGVSEHPDDA